MSNRLQAYLYLSLAMILVGSTVTASKVIGASLPPFTATAMRFAIALPLFLLLLLLKRKSGASRPRLARSDLLLLVLQAAAGSIGYSALMIMGLRLTTAANASVMIGTLPVVATAIAVLMLGEHLRLRALVQVLLATAGVMVITFHGAAGDASLLGDLLVFGAVACEAVFVLLNKRLKTPVEPLAQSAWMTGLGLLLVSLPAAWEMSAIVTIPTEALWAVVYYAVFPTFAGYLLWYAGSARASATEASLFTALAPVSGLALSGILLSEPIGAQQLLGAACVVAAIMIAITKPAGCLQTGTTRH